jgi:hypothetical protein
MTYLTDREIHVIGIQRTGQHAITSWILGHFDKVCYKNSMSQLGMRNGHGVQPPFWYFQPKLKEGWEVSSEDTIRSNQDAIILGTEFKVNEVGLNPKVDKQKEEVAKKSGFDKFSAKQDYVLVLRDPYNHYASVLKWARNKKLSPPKSFATMWKKMAIECLGETDHFECNSKTVVLYDSWFNDINYRVRTEEILGLKRDDSRLNTVMKIGIGKSWGSSFDGMKVKNKAQKMDVLNRWESVKDDPRFIKLCQDQELVKWAEECGWGCPL